MVVEPRDQGERRVNLFASSCRVLNFLVEGEEQLYELLGRADRDSGSIHSNTVGLKWERRFGDA